MKEDLAKEIIKKISSKIEEPNYIIDLYDLSLTWCNDDLADLFEYEKEEILNKNVLDMMSDSYNDAAKRKRALQSLFKSYGSGSLEIKTKSGKTTSFEYKYARTTHKGTPYEVGRIYKKNN